MTSTETKLKDLREYLDTLIGEYREAVSSALRKMEKLDISPLDFRKESFSLSIASFTLGFLNRIKEVAEKFDYKTTENYIRFHRYQLETKSGSIEDNQIKVALDATISALSNIIDLYLDK